MALQTRIAELCGHLYVLHAQLVDTIVEALDGELWQQWGIRSPEHWLAWQTGLAPTQARQEIGVPPPSKVTVLPLLRHLGSK